MTTNISKGMRGAGTSSASSCPLGALGQAAKLFSTKIKTYRVYTSCDPKGLEVALSALSSRK